jgi:hypothetical protein
MIWGFFGGKKEGDGGSSGLAPLVAEGASELVADTGLALFEPSSEAEMEASEAEAETESRLPSDPPTHLSPSFFIPPPPFMCSALDSTLTPAHKPARALRGLSARREGYAN